MARGFIKRNNLTKDTLLAIGLLGAAVAIGGVSPHFVYKIARSYFKDKAKEIIWARSRKLKELNRRKLINFKELGGGRVRLELTHKGKTLVRQYNLDQIKIQAPKRWDRKWRILMYDIPTHQKRASNAFREKLKDLGLFQLQRSVWVSPYECLAEIEFLATVFEIDMDRHICYFKTSEVSKEKEIKEFFNFS